MTKKITNLFLIFALAAEPLAAAMLPRKILALYDPREISGDFKDISFSKAHRFAEMPLNHLGMELAYQDIQKPLPDLAQLKNYRGALLWLTQYSHLSENTCAWLDQAMQNNLKVCLILGNYNPDEPTEDLQKIPPACGQMFRTLGVRFKKYMAPDPVFLDVMKIDETLYNFERKLDLSEIALFPVTQLIGEGQSLVSLRSGEDANQKFEPVVTTSKGGLALAPFVLYRNKEVGTEQFRLRLNLFKFFERVFALEGWPRPDTTTLNGRRIFYSHVDGDGFFNVSEADQKSWSGKIFYREIMQRYANTPISISLITGYYDMRRYDNHDARELAKAIFKLPNIDPASHTYTHPLIWHQGKLSLDLPDYKMDSVREIIGSIQTINEQFLDAPKKTELLLWSGNCAPTEEQIQLASENRLLNLNGGDTRKDRFFNSYAYVMPISRLVGRQRQIYASNSNENTYTNLWKGPYDGYRHVLETFKNTEEPLRIKPLNVYMHFYSAEKIASLKVLKEVYDWALQQPLVPIRAAEYVRMAQDFFNLNMVQENPNHYRFSGGERLQTIRFDQNRRYPDLGKSKGVIGYRRFQNNLYVFLERGQEREIVLTQVPPTQPYLEQANFQIEAWQATTRLISFRQTAWWAPEFTLKNLLPNRSYTITIEQQTLKQSSDAQGALVVDWKNFNPNHNVQLVEIKLAP